ncbi:hypothetical protein BU16DRAFT_450923 [Lophium mytilinum]|uniref:Uncharacterized protein n=1 Tax=Lophium mytilinum TaxID=390894 RepID=A0A6A6R903_9PEZI|nr:hypothetical protein BU16DRAFT_450923 [Lophium mytilinum]
MALTSPGSKPPDECYLRSDDSGIWNGVKAWYIFLLHLIACGLSVFSMIQWIDDRNFYTGSPPSIFQIKHGLYQTQVTGLISVGLVGVRLLAGICTGLLVWRTIFILLEKRGMSLAEISHLSGWRTPVFLVLGSTTGALWSIWAAAVIVLLWPSSFASPLATSSVAWLPSTRLHKATQPIDLVSIANATDWSPILYDEMRYSTIVSTATNTGRDPSYVFNSTNLPLRRYFDASSIPELTTRSVMGLAVPYFDIKLKWVNNATVKNTDRIGAWEYVDVNNNTFSCRSDGAVNFLRDVQWDSNNATPKEAGIFNGTKLVVIKVLTMTKGMKLDDGTIVDEYTPCPTTSSVFGKLPDVGQYQNAIVWSNNQAFSANDCYLIAEASITAGKYAASNCTVSPSGSIDRYATCQTDSHNATLQDDWLRDLALDFLSEALKYTVLQNFTDSYMRNSTVDQYTTGMLTLGYHAAWSALMGRLGNTTETAHFVQAEQVVKAEIERRKLYGWLGMNITLTASAILVYLAQTTSRAKTVRDTALAAMTMELTEVMHSPRAKGLCNAVALNKRDKKLPRLKWKESVATGRGGIEPFGGTAPSEERSCRRRLAFVDETQRQSQGSGIISHKIGIYRPTGYEQI